ncbi:hypothetical protein GIB67_024515 [Kingdonia uniflora]|uniref:KIB1-4 beta-propeller domain-containing protein n=1 Tax=Kingdonia uniflora TaxID=39325 RepID=A0A7J7LP14_9MAGN|nr:hypothetical protein GIB67_024515 [Kingdonia uniflora]
MVYGDGNFYIGDLCGRLQAFNVNNQKWNVLIKDVIFEGTYRNILLESGGELLVVAEYFHDISTRRKETVESLGDRALFLGPTSFLVLESAATHRIANLIYTCEREELDLNIIHHKLRQIRVRVQILTT